jgi:uncharacterized BrkB/YihY/UPF0761 family membrane protein
MDNNLLLTGLLAFLLLFFVKNLFGLMSDIRQTACRPGDGVSTAMIIRYSFPALLLITAVYLIYLVISENRKTERMNKKYYE